MIRFKKILIIAIAVMAAKTSFAQYEADVLRFSQFKNSNTARFDALGGSKTSIGGDLSSLFGNPAGIGMYTKSDFAFTPGFRLRNNSISINGANSSVASNNADLNNFGVVFNTKTFKSGDLQKGILSYSFGVGYQKKGFYRNDFNFNNGTNQNGLGNYLLQRANNESPQDVEDLKNLTFFALQSHIIDTTDQFNPPNFENIASGNANQSQMVRRSGGSSSIDFTLGLNISNQLFLGGSIGLTSFRYTASESVNERGRLNPEFNTANYDVDYVANYDTEGSGINLKLGAILKPTSELSLGISFESPTWYRVNDNFIEDFNDNIQNIEGADPYDLDYNLRTPLKLNGGITYFFDKKGFISADIGFTDYSTIKFTSDNTSLDRTTNRDIKNLYKNAINASVGGEIKVSDQFLLRAGYQFEGNPYQNRSNSDFSTNAISGGFGYRFGSYYLDLSLVNSNSLLNYGGYTLDNGNQPIADIETRHNNIALTFGVKF